MADILRMFSTMERATVVHCPLGPDGVVGSPKAVEIEWDSNDYMGPHTATKRLIDCHFDEVGYYRGQRDSKFAIAYDAEALHEPEKVKKPLNRWGVRGDFMVFKFQGVRGETHILSLSGAEVQEILRDLEA